MMGKMMEDSHGQGYFLIRTERWGVGEIWALPTIKSDLLSENSKAEDLPFLKFDPEAFKDGFPLTPDEIIRRGSARLRGLLKESDFPFISPTRDYSEGWPKSHFEFLVYWGLPGGIVGGYELYPQVAAFLNDFLQAKPNCQVMVTGPKRALSAMAPFLNGRKGVHLLAPNEVETWKEDDPLSIVLILDAEQAVSFATSYFFALLKIPKRLVLAQFNTRDFFRTSRKEALSKIFGVSYYSVIWDYCILDPNSFSFFEPKSYSWVAEQASSVDFAEFTLEDDSVTETKVPGRFVIPTELPVKGSRSFFEDAEYLAFQEEDKAEFVPFRKYYPTYSDMSPAQLKWYLYWRSQARRGMFLDTDLSYIFLYVYELLNKIGIFEPLEGLLKLRELWLNYREKYPKLDHYLVDWIADYAIIYSCPVNPVGIYKEALKFGFVRNPDLLLEEFLQGPIEEIPIILFEELSFYKFLKSPFFRKEGNQNLELELKRALAKVDNFFRERDHVGIFKKFRPQAKIRIQRFPFQGAIFRSDHNQMITLGTAFPYSRYPPLCNFFTSLVKEIENGLREKFHFPGRLGGYELPPLVKKVIREALKEGAPEPLVPAIEVDTWKVKELIRESDEVRELIQKFISQEHGIDGVESPVTSGEEPSPSHSIQETAPDLKEVPPEWRQFASKLRPFQAKTLAALLSGKNTASQIVSISRENALMPEALLDSLNELSLETVGDLIVDCSVSPPVLFEENRDIINQLIALVLKDEHT